LSYRLKLPRFLQAPLRKLHGLNIRLVNEALDKHWNENIIDQVYFFGLSSSGHDNGGEKWTLPAFKFFGDSDDVFSVRGLPSRYRRCILERVGEILRSQKRRKDCFYDVLQTFPEFYAESSNLPSLRKRKQHVSSRVMRKLYDDGKFYRSAMIKQVTYQLANYVEREKHLPVAYTECVKPATMSGTINYSPDDGQLLRLGFTAEKRVFGVSMKLPTPKGWRWFTFTLKPHGRMNKVLESDLFAAIRRPLFLGHRQKSGLQHYELGIPVELRARSSSLARNKFLCVDVGLRKLAALVVMNTHGEQLSPPVFIRSVTWRKVKALKKEIENLRCKLSRSGSEPSPTLTSGIKKRQNKLNNLATQTIHEFSNVVVGLAEAYGCSVIVLEDLRFSEVEKGLGLLSWMLSRWPRGYIHQYIKYKAALMGMRVETVPARDTSRRCPRCGAYGVHIRSWSDFSEVEAGGFFLCKSCNFMGDRDYVGALNAGRAYCADLEASGGTLAGAKPSIYMLEANPLANRSVRGAEHLVSRGYTETKATTFSTITISGRTPLANSTSTHCTI